MPEGLFRPDELTLPGKVRAALPAVVRVFPRIRFRVSVFPTQAEVDAARARPGAFAVTYLDGGGVAWPYRVSAAELRALRADPLARIQSGRRDVVQATRDLDLDALRGVWEAETPELSGSATGAVVGLHGGRALIATNYHVAREAIGRHGREGGQPDWAPVDTRDVRVSPATPSPNPAPTLTEDVQLVSNASRDDWGRGLDWALLSVPAEALPGAAPLPLAAGANAGEAVWALGFPLRSARTQTPGYANADGTLRVSTGRLTQPDGEGWHADLDGLAGNSGSPVLNACGELVGLFRNHTHYDYPPSGPLDRRFLDYGGEAQLAPTHGLARALASVEGRGSEA